MFGEVAFACNCASTARAFERSCQFLLIIFLEIIWVKGFLVVSAVALPSGGFVVWWDWYVMWCVGLVECFKHFFK